jgi:large subunit ribosomal protein L10
MNREEKSAAIDEIAAQIEGSEAIFAVDYRGISVSQAAELRSRLREADASFRVVKNRLTKLAADKTKEDRLPELLQGPTALTFVRGDTASAAKAISTFNKEHDVLTFKGGFMGELLLDGDKFSSIARLPSRETLDGQLAGVVASPLTGLVRGLGSMIQGLALQLGQIAEKGLVSGEAPAAEAEATTGEPQAQGEDTSEEPSKSDDSAPSEEAPEAEQGEADPPAAEAEPSTSAEADAEESAADDEGGESETSDEDSATEEPPTESGAENESPAEDEPSKAEGEDDETAETSETSETDQEKEE